MKRETERKCTFWGGAPPEREEGQRKGTFKQSKHVYSIAATMQGVSVTMTKGKTLIELIGRRPREPRDWYRITKFSVIIHPLGFVKKHRQDLNSKNIHILPFADFFQ